MLLLVSTRAGDLPELVALFVEPLVELRVLTDEDVGTCLFVLEDFTLTLVRARVVAGDKLRWLEITLLIRVLDC